MGVNEHGVAIGNEAVFTKEPTADTGLLGMDLMRLALERAEDARGALDVIVDLLETFGQGGSCDIYHPGFTYHNSFIIADRETAWVLETAGKYWAAVQVEDVYSISNGLTIGGDFDLASDGLVEHAVERGWCKGASDFDFARCYSDFFYTRIATACKPRRRRSLSLLTKGRGAIDVPDACAYLRDHGPAGEDPHWSPARGKTTVCMHAADNRLRRSQSTASLVAHLRPGDPVCWMTGTSGPCTGLFKPFYIEPVPDGVGEPTGTDDPETLFWAHERLHRAVLQDYPSRTRAYADERDGIEAAFIEEERALYQRHGDAEGPRPKMWAEFSALCLDRAAVATERWAQRVAAMPIQHRPGVFYRRFWQKQNQTADFATSG
jgi:dipeptidase